MKINIEKLRIDGDTQSRTSIQEKTIMEYTELLMEGVKMPPVRAFFDGLDTWLADGFHRYHAHRRAKLKEIECEITKGTKRDAKIYSLGANHDHGLPRTNEDKRKSVITCLEDIELSMLSDHEIARICKVSHMTVGRIRKELELAKDDKKKAKKLEQVPKVSKKDEVLGEETRDEKLQELSTENSFLLKENLKLRDQIAVGQLELPENEKMEVAETLETLRAEVSRLQSLLDAMTISRNDFQQKAADAINQVKYWKKRAEKAERK